MRANSIRTSLNKEDAVSEIRLLLGDLSYRRKVFVVVEGADDVKIMKKLLNENAVILESYSGKRGVHEIVLDYFPDNDRIIGVRDKDHEQATKPKVFFYDYCCLEMMIIACEESIYSLFSEYYLPNHEPVEWIKIILSQLYLLSLVRQKNEIQRWGLVLKSVSIPNIMINGQICNEKLVDQIRLCNIALFNIHKSDIEDMMAQTSNRLEINQLFEITNGHDFSSLYAALYNFCANKNVKRESIEASLRCSYRRDDFFCTNLYQEFVNYQQGIGLNII